MGSYHSIADADRIAIVGMAGRFPGAKDVDQFWRNLRDGVESISFFSDDELRASGIDPALLGDPDYVNAASVLEDIDRFDGGFFGYSPREAEIIEPQQRFFLECAHEVLEVAGYNPEVYEGRIGVYAGASENDYWQRNLRDLPADDPVAYLNTVVGNDKDYLATRVSYKLNLTGPSLTVQSACSTSLVAAHVACQALLNGECDMALAGGVSIRVPQKAGYLFREGMIHSPDGHCRTFDAKAKGTVFGSGVGVILLKRLADAVADNDVILAVIRGSAVNNDGSAKIGYTAPSLESQAAVIVEALDIAGIEAETVNYVECHGTGTSLGDPIEMAALTKAFRVYTAEKQFCAIGSVKTNIGHLNVAAGIASLIKVIQALRHKEIPPSLHFERPNPKIDFGNSPFFVNTALTYWKPDKAPRRAGVSSFGVGGTNAHLVLEEAPFREPSNTQMPQQLLVLSAKSRNALETATTNLTEHLKQYPGLNIGDAAYTLAVGRKAMNCRRMAICRGQDDAVSVLQTRDPKLVATSVDEPRTRSIVFMFTGQGAQYVGMARELYDTVRPFRQHVDRCSESLKPHLGLDLRDVLYPRDNRVDEAALQLTQTAITQPSLFVIEYALASLLMEWGIQPQAMVGHSIGEYVAACLAGVFSLEDGLELVAARGRLMSQLPPGAMLAVPLPAEEVQPFLGDELSLATINAPSACVVSGPSEAVDWLDKELVEKGIEGRRLHTSHAFHSHMMEPMLEPFEDQVKRIKLNAPQIPYLSNVTGTWITSEQATNPHYWARQIRQTVRFSEGVGELLKQPDRVFMEVGPGETLTQLARRRADKAAGQIILSTVRHPREQQSDVTFFLGTMGKLWLAGVEVNWTKFYEEERRYRVALPTYPFERQRYWVESAKGPSHDVAGMKPATSSSTQKQDVNDLFYIPSWRQSMPPFPLEEKEQDRPGTHWLVFLDENGIGSELARQMERQNHEVVTVAAGNEYAAHDKLSYTIRPGQPDDYNALFETLARSDKMPERIVHAWTVASPQRDGSLIADIDSSQELGFYSLLYLAQALGRQKMGSPLRLWIVSNGLYDVTGYETLDPGKATILGPCKTIPQEYANITCRCLDIDLPKEGGNQPTDLANSLLAEINSSSTDPFVAYRAKHRWVLTYEPVKFDPVSERNPRLREGGVYLITGGFGGIGLVLAEHLARTLKAKLILVGRSSLPQRHLWEDWLTAHGEHDETSRRILKIRELEKLEAEVFPLSGDVTNVGQMMECIAQAKTRFGVINGVIHAAGIAGGGVIQLKGPEVAAKVLAPKVKGTLVLDEVLRDTPLDWFVLCSSTLAVTTRYGQVDYCGANAFLDAFAHYKSSVAGCATISINWDGWLEVGMAVNALASAKLSLKESSALGRGVAHPLLNQCILESADGAVFSTEFSVQRHWVLAEHHILGNPVVPGTAWLEMARAAFEDHMKTDMIQMSEIFFTAPFSVGAKEQKKAYTVLEKDGDHYDFCVLTRSVSQDGQTPEWVEHVRGKIRSHMSQPTGRLEIGELLKRCEVGAINEPEGSQGNGDTLSVYWGPRWRSVGKLYLGENEVLGEVELPREFIADLDTLTLHPALVDVATSLPCLYASEGRYQPFSYEQVTIRERLPARFFSHVRFDKNFSKRNDVVSFDVSLINDQGRVLVEIKGVTFRRVENRVATADEGTSERQRMRSDPPRLPEERARHYDNLVFGQKQPGRLDHGILPSQGVEAFQRILARCAVPQVIVSTRTLQPKAESGGLTASPATERSSPSSPSEHTRPDLGTTYVAPSSEAERLLAEIWQERLGITRVGIKDNFFELGGDSVIAIQIIVKANKAGFRLAPSDIFEYQTITELAAVGTSPQDGESKKEQSGGATIQGRPAVGGGGTTSGANEFNWSQDELDAIAEVIKKSIGDK